jgi:hypothetical protein
MAGGITAPAIETEARPGRPVATIAFALPAARCWRVLGNHTIAAVQAGLLGKTTGTCIARAGVLCAVPGGCLLSADTRTRASPELRKGTPRLVCCRRCPTKNLSLEIELNDRLKPHDLRHDRRQPDEEVEQHFVRLLPHPADRWLCTRLAKAEGTVTIAKVNRPTAV